MGCIGSCHVCFAVQNGGNGQLGNGKKGFPTSPVRVNGAQELSSIVAGDYHTCALNRTGEVFCWGKSPQNGHPYDTDEPDLPVVYVTDDPFNEAYPSTKFVALSAGMRHTCALDTSADIYCWVSHHAQLRQAQLAFGIMHVCCRFVLKGDGTGGGLANGFEIYSTWRPGKVPGNYSFVFLGSSTRTRTCAIATKQARAGRVPVLATLHWGEGLVVN